MLEKISQKIALRISAIQDLIREAVIKKQAEPEVYITYLYKYLLNREPEEAELKLHLSAKQSYLKLFQDFLATQEYHDEQERIKINLSPFVGFTDCLLGEYITLTPADVLRWYQKAAQAMITLYNQNKFSEEVKYPELVVKDKDFTLTIITSLYQGEKYINTFLENMLNQTIFSECQLFIVDANSPENEQQIIEEYAQFYPNIKYLKMSDKIGIYEAWNLAIKESDSAFITNANVDDVHRKDAFELKVKALKNNPNIDVVYSDVYYSFLENLPFEVVEECGLKTNLPTANKLNLLKYNAPHNSPMWRRAIHEKLGYFDSTYKSAGDYEFWLRAAFSGINFLKIEPAVVSYYSNPEGMSTRIDSPGVVEAEKILKIYQNLYNSQSKSRE